MDDFPDPPDKCYQEFRTLVHDWLDKPGDDAVSPLTICMILDDLSRKVFYATIATFLDGSDDEGDE